MIDSIDTPMKRQTLLQIWVASSVLVNMYAGGMILAFPSILLPDVMSKDSSIKMDRETGSWFAFIIGVAIIPGFLVIAVLTDWCGRRFCHLLVAILAIIGWVMIYLGQNVTELLIGRALGGLYIGGTFTLGAMVIGEYTSPKLRGFFLNFKTAVVCLGKLTVHGLGYSLHWRNVAVVALLLHIISVFMTLTWPLSPAWLIYKNKFEKSEQSFFSLRGRSEETEKEFADMVRAQKERQALITDNTLFGRIKDFFKKFFRKDFLKPFAICAVANAMLECTGRHFFPQYAIQLIDTLTAEKETTIYVVLGIDAVAALGAATTAVLASSVRRRTLLFSSGFAAVLVLAVFCIHQYLVSLHVATVNTWIPTGLLFIYFIIVNLGASPMPLALMGELFPLQHRGFGPGLSSILISLYMMISLRFTLVLLDTIGIHGVFAVYGGAMAAFLVLLYFILPETKDKTLQEIEDYFKSGRLKDDDHTRHIIRSP